MSALTELVTTWREEAHGLSMLRSVGTEAGNEMLLRCAAELESALAAECGAGRDTMTFAAFSAENRARCEAPNGFNHPVGSWSLSDWMTATMGELGEAANAAKKLNRVRDGIVGNDETEAELRANFADELADTFIYLDLLAQSQGIDLAAAVRAKFDRTSKKIGYTPPAEASRGE